VDVGEALAGFGNAQFPERSGEARAVLAADYKALLSEYLRHLGGVLVPGACTGLSSETEVRVRMALFGGDGGGVGGVGLGWHSAVTVLGCLGGGGCRL